MCETICFTVTGLGKSSPSIKMAIYYECVGVDSSGMTNCIAIYVTLTDYRQQVKLYSSKYPFPYYDERVRFYHSYSVLAYLVSVSDYFTHSSLKGLSTKTLPDYGEHVRLCQNMLSLSDFVRIW